MGVIDMRLEKRVGVYLSVLYLTEIEGYIKFWKNSPKRI